MVHKTSLCVAAVVAILCNSAHAHFIWLVPQTTNDGSQVVRVYFGEDSDDDNPDFLARLKGMKLRQVVGADKASPVDLAYSSDALTAAVGLDTNGIFVASHDLGIMDRGDAVFRLKYYAKAGPVVTDPAWTTALTADDIRLDVHPALADSQISLGVVFDGKPVTGAQVTVARPGMDDFEGITDSAGEAVIPVSESGVCSIRVRHIEAAPGELKGKKYPETRHYTTIALAVPGASSAASASTLDNLPQPVTSFGAAVLQDAMYLYGGHTGSAHSYSMQEQSNELTRLDLKTGKWSTVIDGPHLQGLALVADGNSLYRVGGFTAMNTEGEEHNLQSQDCVARFDPQVGVWTELAPLPERRSSHDAAVVGNTLYVAGGWMMGDDEKHWHSTAWKMDLDSEKADWQPIAAQPFRRRAIALAAHNGMLYVIGGMEEDAGPTTAVSVYDPASDTWSEGPSLIVKADPEPKDDEKPERSMSSGQMAGFGASAFATGGALYVTTVQGLLQRLSADGKTWEVISSDVTPRFFHRLLPLDEHRLITVGGSNMTIGKFDEVEVIDVQQGT